MDKLDEHLRMEHILLSTEVYSQSQLGIHLLPQLFLQLLSCLHAIFGCTQQAAHATLLVLA